ncbi:MAG: HlyC/CorC family transporter [Chloroflexi bacterium]|nr:MAG: HlyC/CorC family transporter [Chloroflexota bacterium]
MQVFSNLFAQLGIILALTIANGIFSMAELSIVSSRKVRLQQRAEDGDKKARTALELAESPNRFLSTVQVGITLIGTLAGALGGAGVADDVEYLLMQVPLLRPYAAGLALALVVLLVAYLSLVLGELVPKRLALADPEGIAGNIAGPMKWLSVVVRPVIWLLSVSTEAVLRLLRVRNTESAPVTPEEITGLMEQGEVVGVFEEAETDIVESIFRLGDLRAGALMTPRTEIDWLDLDEPFAENLRRIMDSPHTHFPVAQGSLDNVQGILRGKDILARITDGKVVVLQDQIQPALFIPESMPAFEVVELLKGASGNLALVIDEYGGLLGIVTLFDVMEAIVGGISERGEPVVPEAIQREDGSWLVEGMMRIDEFKKLFDIDELPEEEHAGYQTVGGFIMTMIGAVPQAGQHFNCCGWRYEVLDMDGMRVDKVLVGRE